MVTQNFELWSGQLPISDVIWTFLPDKKFDLSSKFLREKNEHWRNYLLQFPLLYDGDLLFLDNFSVEDGRMVLTTRSMKFSTLTYLERNKIKLTESLGSLGFQLFIRDPMGENFLLGNRAQSSEYKPGHYTIPGGMFEVDDSVDSVTNACLREINEELHLTLDPNTIFLTAILRELNNLGSVLLLECSLDKKIHSHFLEQKKLVVNEEWEGSNVYWFPFASINE
ncbi:MAG: NUDIX hydrolase, partial [Candidatus Hodarchaeales archaeon]